MPAEEHRLNVHRMTWSAAFPQLKGADPRFETLPFLPKLQLTSFTPRSGTTRSQVTG